METKRNGGEKDDSEDLISLHLIGQGMQNLETMDSLLAVKSSNSFQQGRTGKQEKSIQCFFDLHLLMIRIMQK